MASETGQVTDSGPTKAADFQYKLPKRAIFVPQDLHAFRQSQSYKELMLFVRLLNESVKGKKKSDSYPVSEALAKVESILDTMDSWIDEIPPEPSTLGRFGNKAFKTFHARLVERSPHMLSEVLPSELHAAVVELLPYLQDAFGNPTRIDYGSGHETCFVMFLCCLYKIGYLQAPDCPAIVLRVFDRYLRLMRRLQTVYMLEPAGSHGVWGLDDYQMLVFYWGASQLLEHPLIQPSSIHNEDIISQFADDYLYLDAIKFITTVKKGVPFAESSPMLNDISGVPSWTKVNSGMLKYYDNEVLGKLPVIQHFVFGAILPCDWEPAAGGEREVRQPNLGVKTQAPWAAAGADGLPATRAPWAAPCASTAAPWANKSIPVGVHREGHLPAPPRGPEEKMNQAPPRTPPQT